MPWDIDVADQEYREAKKVKNHWSKKSLLKFAVLMVFAAKQKLFLSLLLKQQKIKDKFLS